MEEVSDESFGSTLLTGVPRKTLENTMRTPPYTVSSSMKTDNLTALRPLSKKAAPQLYSPKKEYFRNYMKSQTRHFSSLVMLNSATLQDNRLNLMIFMKSLTQAPQTRSEQDLTAIAKLLHQEQMFPQLGNDINLLKLLAKTMSGRICEPDRPVLSLHEKDESLVKVLRGELSVKFAERTVQKTKGEFLQQLAIFNPVKNYSATTSESTYLLLIDRTIYQEALKLHTQHKVTVKMMGKTSLLGGLKKKHIAYLFEHAKETMHCAKQVLFKQGDTGDQRMYFVVQGEVQISKAYQSLPSDFKSNNSSIQPSRNNSASKQNDFFIPPLQQYRHSVNPRKPSPLIICRLNNPSFIGEQAIFFSSNRSYTATIMSCETKLIMVSRQMLLDMFTHFEVNFEEYYKKCGYRQALLQRIEHYNRAKEEALRFKERVDMSRSIPVKVENSRIDRMTDFLRRTDLLSKKIQQLSEVQHRANSHQKEISLQAPLFKRQDFPELKALLKRYALMDRQHNPTSKVVLPLLR